MNNTLISELKQNTRLRLGVWLILAILAGYGLMLLDEQRQNLTKDYSSKLEHLGRLQSVANQTQWAERMQQISQMKIFFEEKLWRADTQGLATADVQTWLNSRVQHVKLSSATVRVENAVEMPKIPNLWMVSAEIRAEFTPSGYQQLLYALHFNKWVVVESANVSSQGSKPYFSMNVRVYFQKTQ